MKRSDRIRDIARGPRLRLPRGAAGAAFGSAGWRLAFAVAVLLSDAPAHAIIKVSFPVSRIYKESQAVLLGVVSALNPEEQSVGVTVSKTCKGASPGERVRIKVGNDPALFAKVAVGQPVVLFLGPGRGATLIHLADTWQRARREAGGDEPLWTATGGYDAAASFPGGTAGLVRILQALKAGRPGIQDWISHEGFLGGIHPVGRLAAKPTFLIAPDLNGDGLPDPLVGTSDRVRLYMGGAQGFTEATEAWGLAGVSAAQCASGDLDADGRPDLLLGGALWANRGQRLVRLEVALPLPAESKWAAAALADATDDGQVDAVVLERTGRLTIAVNPGAPGKPWTAARRSLWEGGAPVLAALFSTEWGDDGKLHVMVVRADGIFRYAVAGGPPADFERLTGVPLSTYSWLGPMPLEVVLCAAFDYEGNGRTDFLLVTPRGGVTLANRGYGAFLINRFVHQQLDPTSPVKLPKLPVPLTRGAVTAGGRVRSGRRRCQDLLLLTEDGILYEMDGGRR